MPDPMPPPGGPDPLDRIFDALGVSRLAHMIDDGDDCHPAPSERFNEAAAVTPDGTIEPRRTSSSLSNLQFLIQSRPKAFAIAAALRAGGAPARHRPPHTLAPRSARKRGGRRPDAELKTGISSTGC